MIYRIKEISWFKQKFLLDIPGPNDYSIEGSFWKHDYVFTRKNGLITRLLHPPFISRR